jgi:hypothetical protein
MIFLLRRLRFLSSEVDYVLQNKNGPCPLVAIVNTLLLEKRLTLPSLCVANGCVDSEILLGLVAEVIIRNDAKREKNGAASQEDSLAALSKLGKNLSQGMDINVRFSSSNAFEFTEEIGLFDALGLTLLHAWVVDSVDSRYPILKSLSYNEALNRLVSLHEACAESNCEEASAIESFLNEGQVTYPGLLSLFEVSRDNQIFCLYKQGHFSCAFKRRGRLYQLVSDVSFIDTPVAWESLDEILGDSELVTAEFASLNTTVSPQQNPPDLSCSTIASNEIPVFLTDDKSAGQGEKAKFTPRTPQKAVHCRMKCMIM